MRIVHPQLQWTPEAYLLAALVDQTAGGNWQRGGGKGPRPKPLERPHDRKRNRMGTARPLHEARGLLDRWKAGEITGPSVEHRRR